MKIGKLEMSKKSMVNTIVIFAALIVVIVLACVINNGGEIKCPDCLSTGEVYDADAGAMVTCETCGGTGTVATDNPYQGTFMALLPPIIAIVLALVTKEVYSSLFIGILAGALFKGSWKPIASLDTIVKDGFIGVLADSWNMGIIIFLVVLGIMVALINKAGGAQAFGRWAKKHIKTKIGAQLATFFLGVLIFVDDYFNCLTVGSVMRPLTDSKKISREKLAYLIDATAAPICMIAPISSWAAAVSSTASQVGMNGISLFVEAIPYNFYSLLTIVMIITLTLLGIEFGPMKKFQEAAALMDEADIAEDTDEKGNVKGRVIDLVIPIVILILSCIAGMLYSGGFFTKGEANYLKIVDAFAGSDAAFGLSWGSLIALVVVMIYFICRRLLSFKDTMAAIPKGFCAMVPAILILTFAWTLNSMTGLLGAAGYVGNLMNGAASTLVKLLPAIIFLVAVVLSFSTGTSWGTFGILIPIVVTVFTADSELLVIGISACLAGAVCGDHCSPISDTTIMASAGAPCNHVNHVSTQLPYALTVAAVSFISFIIAGFVQMWYVVLPIGIVLMVGTIFGIKYLNIYLTKKRGMATVAVAADGEATIPAAEENTAEDVEGKSALTGGLECAEVINNGTADTNAECAAIAATEQAQDELSSAIKDKNA